MGRRMWAVPGVPYPTESFPPPKVFPPWHFPAGSTIGDFHPTDHFPPQNYGPIDRRSNYGRIEAVLRDRLQRTFKS